jgi:PAS domain S-box-containing protein
MSGDHPTEPPACGLEDVLITAELTRRPSRPPDYEAEARSFVALAQAMASSPATILSKLVETARELCRADSTGISILEPGGESDVFRWRAVAGALAANLNRTMPRNGSPCGTVIQRDAALLFAFPESHYHFSVPRDLPIVEALLVPFHVAGQPIGTVWAVAHTANRKFDAEDARLLTSLSRFAAAAYQMTAALDAEAGKAEQERRAEAALRESEERFRLMVQTVRDYAIFLMDPDGKVASWNEGAQRCLGYTEGEVLGRPGALFFTEEDRRAGMPERELRKAVEGGQASDENWQVRKDGSRFWASGATTALWDEAGKLRGFAKIFRDLTERKAAVDALHEKDLRLRAALSAARMGTWHWDIAADRQSLDENLDRLVGLPPEQTIHTLEDFLRAVHPDDREAVAVAFRRSVEQGVSLNVEFRVVWSDRSVHWLKDQGDVVNGPDARPLYLTGACVDITDRRLLEEELREEARRKDEFLAMLGHELRNPLAPLRGAVETLQRLQPDGPTVERAYTLIERQVEHLTRLVDDLLDVSRITRGLIELHRAPINLSQVADQAVEMANPVIEERGHELMLAMPRKPLWVEGDATRLTQVIFNLLNNAAKYTEPGGKIWLSAEREGEQAVVRVRDNGNGMPPELVSRVFDLFTQGSASRTACRAGSAWG